MKDEDHKKIAYGIMALIVTSFMFSSCSKETPLDGPSHSLTPAERIAQLNAITHYQAPSLVSARANIGAGMLGADLSSAWTGFKIGTEYSGADPLAMACGTVFGGVIGSGFYYYVNADATHPIDTVQTDLNDATLAFAKGYTDTIEKVGYYHNLNILNMFKKGQVMSGTITGMYTQWGPILSKSISAQMGMDTTFYLSVMNDRNFRKEVDSIPSKYSDAIDYMSNFAPNPHAAHPWVDSLYSHIWKLDDADLHYGADYSEAYSDMVKKDKTLDQEDKTFLLDGFSIARYSAALWSANIK